GQRLAAGLCRFGWWSVDGFRSTHGGWLHQRTWDQRHPSACGRFVDRRDLLFHRRDYRSNVDVPRLSHLKETTMETTSNSSPETGTTPQEATQQTPAVDSEQPDSQTWDWLEASPGKLAAGLFFG